MDKVNDSIDFRIMFWYGVISLFISFLSSLYFSLNLAGILLETAIIFPVLYTLSYFTAKIFDKNKFWQKSFFHNSLNCDCSHCKDWRSNRSQLASLFPIIMLIVIIVAASPIIIDMSEMKGSVKETELSQEFIVDFKKLKLELRTRKITSYYSIEKIPSKELVKDQPGNYFIVNLNLANFEQGVLFGEGSYTIDNFEGRLYVPINAFMEEVYYYLDKGANCRLYVKGSADIKGDQTFRNTLGPDNFYNRITFFPENGRGQYLAHEKIHVIKNEYYNSDLPNLRAKFIKEKLLESFDEISHIDILEGKVESKENSYLRNAFMILFVNYDD